MRAIILRFRSVVLSNGGCNDAPRCLILLAADREAQAIGRCICLGLTQHQPGLLCAVRSLSIDAKALSSGEGSLSCVVLHLAGASSFSGSDPCLFFSGECLLS